MWVCDFLNKNEIFQNVISTKCSEATNVRLALGTSECLRVL